MDFRFTPDDLPFLAGLAREAGAVAAGEAFVHHGWLLPRLCAAADPPDRDRWLAELLQRPGLLADGNGVRTVRPGFARYRLAPGGWPRRSWPPP